MDNDTMEQQHDFSKVVCEDVRGFYHRAHGIRYIMPRFTGFTPIATGSPTK